MACLSDRLHPPFQAAQPQVCLVPLDLEAVGLAACADRPVPAGMSINWSAPPSCSHGFWRQLPQQDIPELPSTRHRGQHEVTLGVSGRRAGAPKTMKVTLQCRYGCMLFGWVVVDRTAGRLAAILVAKQKRSCPWVPSAVR